MNNEQLKEVNVFSGAKLLLHGRIKNLYTGERRDSNEELRKVYPVTLELGPSRRCNNRCDFCMHSAYYSQDREIMPFDLYKRLVDEISEYPPDQRTKGMIFSSSGEPLTNPEIVRFIRYTKQRGIDSALITNGSSLGRIDGLLEAIVDDVVWMRVSLNAGSPETRIKIHRVSINDYQNVLNALTELAQLKKEKKSQCHIGAQIVVTEKNWQEIYVAAKAVKETGIDYFQIKPVIYHPLDGRAQLSREFWSKVLSDSHKARKELEDEGFDVFVKEDQFDAIMKPDYDRGAYKQCRSVFFPIIEGDGSVFPCSQTRGVKDLRMGNLHNQTFREIWEGEQRKKILDAISLDKCQPVCRCHSNNKVFAILADKGITPELEEEEEALRVNGGCASSFV